MNNTTKSKGHLKADEAVKKIGKSAPDNEHEWANHYRTAWLLCEQRLNKIQILLDEHREEMKNINELAKRPI